MKNIKIALWASILAIAGAWFMADNLWPKPLTYFSFRGVFNQFSGVLSIGSMSICMILATRPAWLEHKLDGLDKGYRLHKWMGITALVTSTAHWWFTQGTKWMVGWGWLVRPKRGPRPNASGVPQNPEEWLRQFRHLAEDVGQYAFYISAALLIIALIKKIPYSWFAKLHTYMAVLYLALVFHSVILIKFAYWAQPIGWLTAILMAAGSVSAVLVLAKKTGAKRRHSGEISAVTAYPELNGFQLEVAVPGWAGHQAGQFAFIKSEGRTEGAHPFTMASAWDAAHPTLRFVIKKLGDYTTDWAGQAKAGDRVRIEGPYGCFTFDDHAAGQIWVAGGIGITPFLARLETLAATGGSQQPVDLFYSYHSTDPALLAQLESSARAAKVRLHLWSSVQLGHLSGDNLRAAVPDWQQRSVWFCGGHTFGDSLRRDLQANGLSGGQFHQELFEMR